jgi:PTH1 family peptidyl-tRNA hydrolase
MSGTFLIVGLGNPGEKYENTPHNLGFRAVREISGRCKADLQYKSDLKSEIGRVKINGNDIFIAMPVTFMNLSGQAVKSISDYYKINNENIIVLHDDIDLLPGAVQIKGSGGSAGHKGVQSIIDCLGTQEFVRVRIGVGRPERGTSASDNDIADYVLRCLSTEEVLGFSSSIVRAADAALAVIEKGRVAAAGLYNT